MEDFENDCSRVLERLEVSFEWLKVLKLITLEVEKIGSAIETPFDPFTLMGIRLGLKLCPLLFNLVRLTLDLIWLISWRSKSEAVVDCGRSKGKESCDRECNVSSVEGHMGGTGEDEDEEEEEM